MTATRLYVGGYTAVSGGKGSGITVFDRVPGESAWHAVQAVACDDPSFLVLTEGALHAVSETTEGRILSFTVSAGALELASVAASGGASPCHIALDPVSGALVVAGYTGGTVAVVSADPSDPARVARVLALPHGHGPVESRQGGPHAHNVTATPWGTLLVSDLGTDRFFELAVDPVTLEPAFVSAFRMPRGSGPRHFAWYGDQLLVVGELDGRLHVLSHGDDGFTLDYSVAAYDTSVSGGEVLPSHVVVDDGLVYVAVRGRNTITVLGAAPADAGADADADADAGADAGARVAAGAGAAADGGATTGRLRVVAEVSCGGDWPRHFAIDDRHLYVANQLSDTVAVLPLDAAGVPGAPVLQIELGSPACVLFA